MKRENSSEIISKEVVVIGNGPSGIAVSHLLSGNLPYITSTSHPDEMLSMRLDHLLNQCLIGEDLAHLAHGLEGRSNNPVSLLLDALLHPHADAGLEIDPLVEFQHNGIEIDHVVLGKGPPGGSWHRMDPHILTLSLGSWMALPGRPFTSRDSGEKRAFAKNVANYYVQYVDAMNLAKYFVNQVIVTNVSRVKLKVIDAMNSRAGEVESGATIPRSPRSCMISKVLNCLWGREKSSTRCKRPSEQCLCYEQSPDKRIKDSREFRRNSKDIRLISLSCDSTHLYCDKTNNSSNSNSINNKNNVKNGSIKNSCSLDLNNLMNTIVPYSSANTINSNDCSSNNYCDSIQTTNNNKNEQSSTNHDCWLVESYNTETGRQTRYCCKYLILANGASDLPNKLDLSKQKNDPYWLFHDLRHLELHMDRYLIQDDRPEEVQPVLVVGAGLSAADAIIATRGRNIPVVHVFRNKSADLNRQLPENMYPEYHKVHQMMKDGGSSYPLYTAYPEYQLADFDEASRTVLLTSKSGGDAVKLPVSYAIVLIGSRPNLNFFPNSGSLARDGNGGAPIDCKQNTIDVDRLTHAVKGYENLFAIGPLAGDNFVRFIPGGALAVVAELYKRNRFL